MIKNKFFCEIYLLNLLYFTFLISANVAQIFNPIAELAIPIGMWTKEAKAEIETHPLTEEANIRMCLI